MRKTNNLDKWKEYYQKCIGQFPVEVKLLLDQTMDRGQLLNSLKQISSTQEDYKFLKKISVDKDKVQKSRYIGLFRDIDKLSRDKNHNLSKSVYEQVKGLSYLDLVMKMFFALEVGNKYLMNKVLSELVKIPAVYLPLGIDKKINFKDRKFFANLFMKNIERIWNFDCDENLKKMYFQRLLDIEDVELNKIINSLLGEFFVSKITFDKSNYTYGVSYPSYWIDTISDNLERTQYLFDYFKSPAQIEMIPSEYGILRHHLPINESIRKRLALDIAKNFQTYENYEVEAVLQAIENPTFKKYIAKKDPRFRKPAFTIKKNTYLSGLKKDKFGLYGFFELIKLGYEEKLFLWWIL